MKFKEAYIILVPEVNSRPLITVDPIKDISVLDNAKYTCYTVLVQNQTQALQKCIELVNEKGVNVITLCPGFSHKDIAQIRDLVGNNVGICAAHSDDNTNRIVSKLIEQAE